GDWRLLSDDPEGVADMNTVSLEPGTGRPRLVSWRSDSPRQQAVAARDAPALRHLQRNFHGADLQVQLSRGNGPWLVQVNESHGAWPRWFAYEPASAALEDLDLRGGMESPLAPEMLSHRRAVSWEG